MSNTLSDVLDFWFTPPMNQHWFKSTSTIDQHITSCYQSLWEQGKIGELDNWKEGAEGCLALCIVLDQFPLNMFRGKEQSFSTEQQAIDVAKYAIESGLNKAVAIDRLSFLYMPLMHSENLDDQELSVKCFEEAGLEGNTRFAKHHREIIKEYGRFPHRNSILGRKSSPAEIEYLNSKQAFKG